MVLVGAPDDVHIAALSRHLGERGIEAVVLDALSFPQETRLSLGEALDAVMCDGRPLERPGAVYVRNLHVSPLDIGVDADEAMEADWAATLIAFREKATLLEGLVARWEAMGVPVYNPPSSRWRRPKTLQLALLREAGLPVPRTLWTNDPEAVRRFAAGRRIAYKPVTGGAATRELVPEDLSDDRLAALASAPVTFQELLPGDNLRVYVLDGEVVASLRIVSSALDFRQNEERIEPFALPPALERDCLRAAQELGLRWTGMDLKQDDGGTFRFLELNPSPMFLGFDSEAGTHLLDRLVDALVRASRDGSP